MTFENTIINATKYLQPYRSYVTKLEKLNMTVLIIGFLVTLAVSMIVGILYHWLTSLLIVLLFFIIVGAVYYLFKQFQNKHLRQAHFMLALFCRSENNRYYLEKNVELRPGFLANWIEFIVHEVPPDETSENWLLERI